jgi:hypothetical protein
MFIRSAHPEIGQGISYLTENAAVDWLFHPHREAWP